MTASTWTTFLVIICLAFGVQTHGNVGCLLSKQVCAEDEWCYDDFAFGHCMSSYKTISIDDLYRYELETDALKQLEREFRRLFTAGYRWTHTYTQCIVKQMLHAFRRKADFDRKKCDESQDEDLERALKFLEAKDEIDPKDVALIKFKPSLIDSESEYGDELFIPSSDMYSHLLKPDDGVVGVVKPVQTTDTGTDHVKRKRLPTIPGNKINLAAIDRKIKLNRRLTEDEFYELLDMISMATEDDEFPEIIPYPSSSIEMPKPDQESTWSFAKRKGNYDNPSEDASIDNEFDENSDDDNEDDEKVYYVANSPKLDSTFIFDRPHRYDVKKPGPFFKVNNYIFQKAQQEEVTGDPSRETHIFEYHPMFEENDMSLATFRHLHRNNPLVDLTEEGMIHLTPESSDGKNNSNYISEVLKRYDSNGGLDDLDVSNYDYPMKSEHFPMNDNGLSESRLDGIKDRNGDQVGDSRILKDMIPRNIKVLGASEDIQYHPMKDINDSLGRRHLKHSSIKYRQQPGADKAAVIVDKIPEHSSERHESGMKSSVSETEKRIFSPNEFAPKMAHVAAAAALNVDVQPTTGDDFEIVDTSYTYIIVNKEFANLSEGKNYAKKLEALLQLPSGTFSNIRQEGSQIKFKVNPNPNGMTASDVARKAESLKDELQKITDKSLKSSGIGNKIHLAVRELNNSSQVIVITFIVCGVIAGLVLGVGVLYLILHHSRSKQKLQDITQVDTEASQDYQELCRQRMAIKSTEKPEPIQVLAAQRIGGLSRESETSVHSPSSRSSTSSWNEEPIVLNMDISTGHMVLSYMEDHLTNKDRLDKEWEALCKYDADQSVCNVAKESNNFKKNRYPNLLPYDHSRVILNEFCNSAGSDFINASTITDHDPRNAAYIATQGPLPHTSADFWQMIWEQGSVVIVMLTRLVENGVAMCHRYWPEEGSELYHIYEVHLVSEHIWCEDYLIRSFYLKNLKTGETRTVTQFHFLSWPDMGVPVSAKMILDFRRKVNKSYRGRSCPIVVHCSDGCGRTGTYCLIDMVLNRMAKGLKEIDIAATLEHIRDQRFGMVQTKDQFQFVLMAVAEEVHSILKTIP